MKPVVFEARGRPLAGMLYAPEGPDRGAGIVLCNPFGYEAISGHRTYRALAAQLARRGFWALRFDYDGTGDSIGDDRDPGRLAAWVASIDAALGFLRRTSGATSVGLFGARFGALLAAHAAAARQDVASLALWAPLPSGRAFLRELRAFRLLREGQQTALAPGPGVEGEEAAGFFVTPETAEGLRSVDLAKLARAPAPKVLIVPRDDVPSGEDRLAAALGAAGAQVQTAAAAGYRALLLDPHESVVPAEVLDRVTDFFERAHPLGGHVAGAAHAGAELTARLQHEPDHPPLAGPGFVEHAVRFGPGERLFGIETVPAAGKAGPIAVVFINIGAVHRIGSNRMYVRMARRWAAAGIASLRFDLSGLGDSLPSPGQPENQLYRDDAAADVSLALDSLAARTGAQRFALIGLCSGGYVAYYAAQADARVQALALINPQTYRWQPSDGLQIKSRKAFRSTRYYRHAALSRETWLRFARGEIRVAAIALALFSRVRAAGLRRLLELLGRGGSEVAQALRSVAARGTSTYFLFSGDDGGIDALEEHVGRSAGKLRGHGDFRHEVIDGADHTFSPVWSQEELERRLTAFLGSVSGP